MKLESELQSIKIETTTISDALENEDEKFKNSKEIMKNKLLEMMTVLSENKLLELEI
jgi:hypothetical protein